MQERRRAEAFEKADTFLVFVSWALWIIGGMWFMSFGTAAPKVFDFHLAAEPSTALFFSGIFCGSLAKASPRGTWSSWRRMWHLAWCISFGLMSAAFFQLNFGGRLPSGISSMFTYAMIAGCSWNSVGAVLTCPGGQTNPSTGSSFVFGRLLLAVDGILGLLICCHVLLNAYNMLAEPLGLTATLMSALPLGMCSVGFLLCSTDNELIAGLPTALMAHTAGFIGQALAQNISMATLSALAIAVHCAVFLPLPLDNPESNPCHVWVRGYIRRFMKLMTDPVTGFGDENG